MNYVPPAPETHKRPRTYDELQADLVFRDQVLNSTLESYRRTLVITPSKELQAAHDVLKSYRNMVHSNAKG